MKVANPGSSVPLLRDPRLRDAYPVTVIAQIAAAFQNEHPRDKINQAVRLLEAAEVYALTPDETKFRNAKVFADAKRYKGKIRRTDLVTDICLAQGFDYTPETANEKYTKWLEDDLKDHRNSLDYYGYKIESVEAYRALWEDGKKIKVFRSDGYAWEIIDRFSDWFEKDNGPKRRNKALPPC